MGRRLTYRILPLVWNRDIYRNIIRKHRNNPKRYGNFKANDHTYSKVINRIYELKKEKFYVTGYIDLGGELGMIGIGKGTAKNVTKPIYRYAWISEGDSKKFIKVFDINNFALIVVWNQKKVPNSIYYNFRLLPSWYLSLYDEVRNNKPIIFIETNDREIYKNNRDNK